MTRRGRARREERHDQRGVGQPSGGATRYKVRQKMASIGQDFWIETSSGQKAFKVDGKAVRVRSTLIFEDAQGHELYKIQEKIARVRDTMNINDPYGHTAAKVHNAMVTPLRDRWQIDIPGGQNLAAQGNILDHEYKIERGGKKIAQVSKKWFRVRDMYGVEVYDSSDAALTLMLAIVIDMMAHSGR